VMQSQTSVPIRDIPNDAFEYLSYETHQHFGELVAEEWNLPQTLKSLIANHHTYPELDDPLRVHRLMLLLSEMICALLGFRPEVPYRLLETQAVEELGLTHRADFIHFLVDLPEKVENGMIYF
jgi:HD-like signal output (HDOD) protein